MVINFDKAVAIDPVPIKIFIIYLGYLINYLKTLLILNGSLSQN